MNKTVAWALIGASLGVGIIVGQTAVRSLTPAAELGVTCLLLQEAQAAGHLNPQKRGELLSQLAKSPDLKGMDQQIAAMLRGGCPSFPGAKK